MSRHIRPHRTGLFGSHFLICKKWPPEKEILFDFDDECFKLLLFVSNVETVAKSSQSICYRLYIVDMTNSFRTATPRGAWLNTTMNILLFFFGVVTLSFSLAIQIYTMRNLLLISNLQDVDETRRFCSRYLPDRKSRRQFVRQEKAMERRSLMTGGRHLSAV